ncbi:SHOCT domain-containing protein [Arthrobacter bambusae]|uniref:SHOCT domain-containing protein n=1 Tax=Arthrobacter bambusae TaxID=1338426 RepID=UPI00277EE504|nr:SHOCT domain-containing protein [Arthrobacter bambusae]MDQ0028681.1 putative membrane protein [Arthrobacter bambusae]MDQ0096525.1 putative membrane protein [Arthrobacter bambusae]
MMYGWGGNIGIGGWIAMGLMMLLLWGGIGALVIILLRGSHTGGRGFHEPPDDDSERILNERFARGEIDETEFAARRAALRRRP